MIHSTTASSRRIISPVMPRLASRRKRLRKLSKELSSGLLCTAHCRLCGYESLKFLAINRTVSAKREAGRAKKYQEVSRSIVNHRNPTTTFNKKIYFFLCFYIQTWNGKQDIRSRNVAHQWFRWLPGGFRDMTGKGVAAESLNLIGSFEPQTGTCMTGLIRVNSCDWAPFCSCGLDCPKFPLIYNVSYNNGCTRCKYKCTCSNCQFCARVDTPHTS